MVVEWRYQHHSTSTTKGDVSWVHCKAIGRNLQVFEPAAVQKNSVRCILGTHNGNHPFGFHARLSWENSQYEVFQRKAQNLRRPFSEWREVGQPRSRAVIQKAGCWYGLPRIPQKQTARFLHRGRYDCFAYSAFVTGAAPHWSGVLPHVALEKVPRLRASSGWCDAVLQWTLFELRDGAVWQVAFQDWDCPAHCAPAASSTPAKSDSRQKHLPLPSAKMIRMSASWPLAIGASMRIGMRAKWATAKKRLFCCAIRKSTLEVPMHCECLSRRRRIFPRRKSSKCMQSAGALRCFSETASRNSPLINASFGSSEASKECGCFFRLCISFAARFRIIGAFLKKALPIFESVCCRRRVRFSAMLKEKLGCFLEFAHS